MESRYIAKEEQKDAIRAIVDGYDGSNVFVWLPTGFTHFFLSIFDYNLGLTSAQWKCLILLFGGRTVARATLRTTIDWQKTKKKRAAILSDQLIK